MPMAVNPEIVSQSLYDQRRVQSVPTTGLKFFNLAMGAAECPNRYYTNMAAAGMLPSGMEYKINGFALQLGNETREKNAWAFYKAESQLLFVLKVLGNDSFKIPVSRLPSGAGFFGKTYPIPTTTTTGALTLTPASDSKGMLTTYGVPSPNDVFTLRHPIRIPTGSEFRVELENWSGAAISFTDDAGTPAAEYVWIGIYLIGEMTKPTAVSA